MGLIELNIQAKPEIHSVGLHISSSGMTLTVEEGDFRLAGVDYQLAEAQEWDAAPDTAETTYVVGSLVRDKATGDVLLFVDELVGEGVETYEFPGDSPYERLETLFHGSVPVGTTTLDDVDIFVRNIVPLPKVGPAVQAPST